MTFFLVAVAVGGIALLPLGVLQIRREGLSTASVRVLTTISVAVVLFAGWVGWHFSGVRPGTAEENLREHRENPESAGPGMADSFAARLEARDGDASIDELVLLARSYEAERQHAPAAEVYARANRRTGHADADLLVAEAEARLNAPHSDGSGVSVARERLRQALEAEPQHPGAHYFSGSLALQAGELGRALSHLEVVHDSDLLAPEARSLLAERMRGWRSELEGGESAGTGEAGQRESTPDESVVLVRILPAEGVNTSNRMLFVFALAPDGSSMPVVARRLVSPSFPVELTLGDADRLMPEGPSLLSYEQLEIGARLSSSGAATGAPGDPEARQLIQPGQTEAVELRLAIPN